MRQLDAAMVAALTAGVVWPAVFADLTFNSGVAYAWTGYGPLAWNGNTYLGMGQLAGIGDIVEGITVQADGTSVSLSGIDPAIYDACMSDLQIGAPASLWFAAMNGPNVISACKLFAGQIDQPTIAEAPESITISLALENKMVNLQRPNARRYTSSDQHMDYPRDIAMGWVELLQDTAIRWA